MSDFAKYRSPLKFKANIQKQSFLITVSAFRFTSGHIPKTGFLPIEEYTPENIQNQRKFNFYLLKIRSIFY